MGNPRARYTLEFKLEAVRMVKGGQSLAAVAKILDIRPQTLHNWIKAEQQGRLGGAGSPAVSAEQMEIARLKAELAPTLDHPHRLQLELQRVPRSRITHFCTSLLKFEPSARETFFRGNLNSAERQIKTYKTMP